MLRHLIPGDILIETDDETAVVASEKIHIAALLASARHSMIYYEDEQVGKIIHCFIGKSVIGVGQQNFQRRLKSMVGTIDDVINNIVVLRLKNATQAAHLATVASRWNPNLSRSQTKTRPYHPYIFNNLQGLAVLPIPYASPEDRQKQQALHFERNELYRAFRANARNHNPYYVDPYNQVRLFAEPLSKHKGIGCSNFLAYCCKVAYMRTHIPPEILSEIELQVELIERLKRLLVSDFKLQTRGLIVFDHVHEFLQTKNELTNAEKAIQKDLQLFFNFADYIKKQLTEISPANSAAHYNYLTRPIKGVAIDETHFINLEELQYVGHPCLFDDDAAERLTSHYAVKILSHTQLHALSIQQNLGENQHALIVSASELRQSSEVKINNEKIRPANSN